MVGHEVDDWLEAGPAPAFDLDSVPGFRKRHRLSKCSVEGDDIDLLHPVFEEAVNGGKEVL